jgi:hypothetical protein
MFNTIVGAGAVGAGAGAASRNGSGSATLTKTNMGQKWYQSTAYDLPFFLCFFLNLKGLRSL